jgi:DNA-binding MarR family transcriptional regulator
MRTAGVPSSYSRDVRSAAASVGSTPPRLSERATWLVSRAYMRGSALLKETFEAHGDGLSSYHYRLLATLEDLGSASQADLGRATGLDRSDVSTAVAELETRGLVARHADPKHKRRNVVTITKPGSRTLRALDRVIDEAQERFLAQLTPAERRKFIALLHRLLKVS